MAKLALDPSHPAWRLGNLLDVRPAEDFRAGHADGAWNLPWPPLGWEPAAFPAFMLPPRHEPLLVFAPTPAVARAATAFLRAGGRADVDACLLAGPGELPPELRRAGDGRPGLWKPPAFLAEHAGLLPPPAAGPVLDLGCGCGRAAVWLACRGHDVTGVDILPDALALGKRLADAAGARVTFLCRDLRDSAQVPAGPWAAILALRFLERPLLARLDSLLSPGGVAVVRTFRDEPAGAGGPPRRAPAGRSRRPGRHQLRGGELRRLFPDPPFETLVLREDTDPDGRPAAGLVARRRPRAPGPEP